MIDEDTIVSIGYSLEEEVYKAATEIMDEMIRRYSTLKDVTVSDITEMLRLGYKDFEIEQILTDALSLTLREYEELLEKVGEAEYEQYRYVYEWSGVPMEPFKKDQVSRQIIKSIMAQTENTLINFTRTAGIINSSGKFMSLTDYYRYRMSKAVMEIATGDFDYTKAIKQTIIELKNSGIRVVDYESGWHNRVEVATRRAVMTGINQLTEEITNDTADRLGTDHFEVSAHSGARPSHAAWQGRVYTKKELKSVCGLGTGPGLKGWNCYHTYYAFFPGLSERAWTDEQLKEWEHPHKKAYGGKEYTEYEARQRMRQMETQMRAQRQKIHLAKTAGMSKDDIKADQIKYRQQIAAYKEFAKSMGLHTQFERVSGLDGLGRLA